MSEGFGEPFDPETGQRRQVPAVGYPQGSKVPFAGAGLDRGCSHVRERELVEDDRQQNAAQLHESARVFLSRPQVPQPLGEVITKLAHEDGDFVERRGRVRPHLDIYVTVSAGPLRKQRRGQSSVAPAQPLWGYRDVLGGGLQDFVQDARERNGQALRHLRVGEGPLGGIEVPRRAYLAGAALRRRRRLLRRAILTGSFSNARDSTTRSRTTFR